MSQYFLALQTPTVELTVSGTDPAGKQAHIPVGFKRYELEEAQDRMDHFSEVNKPLTELTTLEASGVEIERSSWRDASKSVRDGINEMLREEIIYFLNVQLMEQVPGKPGAFKKGPLIADSRTYKDEAVLGGKSCLDFLLDMHIASSLWRSALISSMLSAINNYKLGAGSRSKKLISAGAYVGQQVFAPQQKVSEAQKSFYDFEGDAEEIIPVPFFLWTTHKDIYDIFNIVRLYYSEMSGVPENMLLKLVEGRNLNLELALAQIPYIFSGYFEEKEKYSKEN